MTTYFRRERIGFTGTRQGMTPMQREVVRRVLLHATEVHHGDCVGADAEVHELALAGGLDVVIHPPNDAKLQAHCDGALMVLPPKSYLARDRDIVDETDLLVATPKELKESRAPRRSSGTWYCVRYARRIGRRVLIVWPDGETFLEEPAS
jgi:hypothetical protein